MKTILEILEKRGPLTGKELLQETQADEFSLWTACRRHEKVLTRIVGRRYLRLDRQVEAYARLSPSIMREFHDYTVIGAAADSGAIAPKAAWLQGEIAAISRQKYVLAEKTITRLVEAHPQASTVREQSCFMIAGDVVYEMAHAEPRPEPSSGEMVRGSDLDIVVVVEHLPEDAWKSLDASIYKAKHDLLFNPGSREELDYLVKDISRVREQLGREDFKSMVAAKILHEARFLYGSRTIFEKVQALLLEHGIPQKMRRLEEIAHFNRELAESHLLLQGSLPASEALKYFYTAEEKEEFF